MLADITTGTRALARAFSLLNLPGVRIYVVIPLLINFLLFGFLIWYGHSLFTPFVDWLMSFVPGFLDFLETLIWLFFGVLAAMTVFFAFTPVANIIAAPFNALMAEKIEIQLTGRAPSSDISFMKMALDAIASQLRKLGYIALWALGLFLVTLIPGINLIAPVLWVVFGSWLLSLEYFDPDGQSRHRLRRAKTAPGTAARHLSRLRRRRHDHDQHPDRQFLRHAGRRRRRHPALGRTVPDQPSVKHRITPVTVPVVSAVPSLRTATAATPRD
jgi:CysZ protein